MKRADIAAWLAEWFGDEAATDEAIDWIAAALRTAEAEALERAAQVVEQRCYNHGPRPISWCQYCQMAISIRALVPSPEAPPYEASLSMPLHGGREALERADAVIAKYSSEPVAPAPPLVFDLVFDALQRCERARSSNTHPPMLCVACAGEVARAARFPPASPAAQGKETRRP